MSRVVFATAGAGAHASARFPGMKVSVRRAPGTKCERCWMVTTDVGKDAELAPLCARCAATVRSLPVARAAGSA